MIPCPKGYCPKCWENKMAHLEESRYPCRHQREKLKHSARIMDELNVPSKDRIWFNQKDGKLYRSK